MDEQGEERVAKYRFFYVRLTETRNDKSHLHEMYYKLCMYDQSWMFGCGDSTRTFLAPILFYINNF